MLHELVARLRCAQVSRPDGILHTALRATANQLVAANSMSCARHTSLVSSKPKSARLLLTSYSRRRTYVLCFVHVAATFPVSCACKYKTLLNYTNTSFLCCSYALASSTQDPRLLPVNRSQVSRAHDPVQECPTLISALLGEGGDATLHVCVEMRPYLHDAVDHL